MSTTNASATPVPTVALSAPTGDVPIPQLGFGVWQVPDDATTEAVSHALDAGYRHVDTARIYGNEVGVGKAVEGHDDVFVTTKIWNEDQGFDSALAAFEASYDRLRLAGRPLDLLLIHWPMPRKDTFVDTYKAMQQLREQGKVRAIGVCNFRVEDLQKLHEAVGEYPSINQIELHPYFNQRELRDFHADNGIVTEAWSPLGQGGDVLADAVIDTAAKAHGKTPAQVVIRWHLQHGNVVIPKSATPKRIVENFDVFDFELTDDEMASIDALTRDDGRIGPDPSELNE